MRRPYILIPIPRFQHPTNPSDHARQPSEFVRHGPQDPSTDSNGDRDANHYPSSNNSPLCIQKPTPCESLKACNRHPMPTRL